MDSESNNNVSTDDSLTRNEQLFKKSLHEHLDSQVENLNYTVSSKLSAARHRALSGDSSSLSNKGTQNDWLNWTNAAGGVLVLGVAVFGGLQFYSSGTSLSTDPADRIAQQVLMEDLNLLSSSDDIEFYQSVEFLEWMETYSG